MLEKINPIICQLEVNTGLVGMALKDMPEEQIVLRPDGKGNSMQWIVGHLVISRYTIGGLIGMNDSPPWKEIFDRGAKVSDASTYPPMAEITVEWENVTAKLLPALAELTAAVADGESSIGFPTSDKTVAGGIGFLSLHESYHVGQLAYLRTLLGHSQLVG